jgi:hypothetical protein
MQTSGFAHVDAPVAGEAEQDVEVRVVDVESTDE